MGIQVTDSHQGEKRSIGLKTDSKWTLNNAGNKLAQCPSFASSLSIEGYYLNYCFVQMKQQFFIESKEKHGLTILRVGRI